MSVENTGEFQLIDRLDSPPTSHDGTPSRIENAIRGLGQGLSDILGGIVGTLGGILSGALSLGVGIFKPFIDGLMEFTKGITFFFARMMAKNPATVYPEFMSPIKADLEGELAPVVDFIKEQHAKVDRSVERLEELGAKQRELTDETKRLGGVQVQILDDLVVINGDIDSANERLVALAEKFDSELAVLSEDLDGRVNSLEAANNALGTSIWTLTDFQEKMSERLASFKMEMEDSLDVSRQISDQLANYTVELNARLASGGDIGKQIKDAADSAAAAGAKGFDDWWAANGAAWLDVQNWYTQWNNQQWDLQVKFNNLQRNWNAEVTKVLDAQVDINTAQSTFNGFLSEFVKLQNAYNDKNTGLWRIQDSFNKSTGELFKIQKWYNEYNNGQWQLQKWYNEWNNEQWELQTKTNQNVVAWQNLQEDKNAEIEALAEALNETQNKLLELDEKQSEFIPRKVIAQAGQVATNDHWRIDIAKRTVTALGTWTGEVALRDYRWRSKRVSGGEGGNVDVQVTTEELVRIPQTNGSRTITLPDVAAGDERNTVALDYWIYRGVAKRSYDSGGKYVVPYSSWHEVSKFTVVNDGNHRILFNSMWNATTYGDRYGVRILLNGEVLASIGPKVRVGPLTSLGNGVRSQNFSEISRTLKVGDVLSFQHYFGKVESGSGSAQATMRSWNRTVAWTAPD